ncbi:MAG: hypothetical protein LAN71_02810 [Acidobacteriia bacterium]|nr:hypothetical protein [Terriglobia bacterium]
MSAHFSKKDWRVRSQDSSGFYHFGVEYAALEHLLVMLILSKPRVYILALAMLISVLAAPTHSQTPRSGSTVIPGIVEPLELTGKPKAFSEPSEVQKRLAGILPQGNDPLILRKAKEAVDALIEEFPASPDALSSRILFSCEINAKDVPINISDIDTIIQLQKSADA